MPYKRCDPVSEDTISTTKWIGSTSVFEKFREIWRTGKQIDSEDIKYKARLAMAMAIRMHNKLLEFDEYKDSGENQEGSQWRIVIVPAENSDMKKKRYLGHFTVCETCREIWRIGMALGNAQLMLRAREAMFMTKRLHERLKEFKTQRDTYVKI